MNKPTLLLAGLLALSGAAVHAQELYVPASYQARAASVVTRAEVRQELARARAAGELAFGDVDYPHTALATTGKSRAEVRAEVRDELIAARKAARASERSGD